MVIPRPTPRSCTLWMIVRFLNHSCGDFIGLQVWSEHSRLRISLLAT
uniref:Uncharacterized protein n=1 Tax=Populus trichocarpa TaxID=3694 RepID=A9PD28_POPTR|nr:unknown [Populus trichocarpa]